MIQRLAFEQHLHAKKIFLTGHTGFTGGWTCLWLKSIGVIVAGYSLPPETAPSLFKATGLAEDIPSTYGDICDYDNLRDAIADFGPDLILHLAAQP